MPIVEEQVRVQVAPQRVWEYLADPAHLAVWDSVVVSATQHGDGPVTEGTVWRGAARLLGTPLDWENMFLEVDADRRRTRRACRAPFPITVTHVLEPIDGATLFTHRVEADEGLGGRFGPLADHIVTRAYARLLRANLGTLKDLLEGDADASS